MKKNYSPVVLCILDGWGHGKDSKDNAITQAHTPTWDRWYKAFPEILLAASGTAVGLPEHQMGNSEVGHTTLGTGRIVLQDLPRIHHAFQENEIHNNKHILNLIKTLKTNNHTCHLMGLFSPGGVHSHCDHIIKLINILDAENISVALHLFLDGRDTPPKSALTYLNNLNKTLDKYKTTKIATIMGRFYAMDRDNRWERTQKAYKAMVHGQGIISHDPLQSIENFYKENITDEFIPPLIINNYQGMESEDSLICANFRADRVRQILEALIEKNFVKFDRHTHLSFSHIIGMKSYSKSLEKEMDVLFPPIQLQNTLGQLLSDANLKQLRIAETEKYAHVTFFFNGGEEAPLKGEERCLIPSPQVSTYDQEPEMSAYEITSTVVERLEKNQVDVIIMNYANADMVGHTGKIEPTIKAIETIDECLSKIEKAVLKKRGHLFITADHGNAEMMVDTKTHQPHTAHTTNLVPFICITRHPYKVLQKKGGLQDVAPTILSFLGISCPKEMTGTPLLEKGKNV